MVISELDLKQAAEKTGLSRSTISRWANKLGIGRKVGTCWLFRLSDLAKIRKATPGKRGNPKGWAARNSQRNGGKTRENAGKQRQNGRRKKLS